MKIFQGWSVRGVPRFSHPSVHQITLCVFRVSTCFSPAFLTSPINQSKSSLCVLLFTLQTLNMYFPLTVVSVTIIGLIFHSSIIIALFRSSTSDTVNPSNLYLKQTMFEVQGAINTM